MFKINYLRNVPLGNMTALYNLGRCYEEGQGIEKNPSKAVEYYKAVSDSEDPNKLKALFKLAEFYRDGKGVKQDFGRAIKNYEKIDILLKKEEKTRAIYLFNLGVLYHKQKPYDLEILEKVLELYTKAQQIDLEGLNIEAQKLKYNNFSDQIKNCQQHILCCKKSKEIIEKNYEKLDEKVKKAILNHGPKLFPNHLIDEKDILNIFGILASLKNANTIETFVLYLEDIFNHNSISKDISKKEKIYYKIQMIKKFSQVSLDKLKLIVENASALFTPQMTWEEILSVVASVNEIEDVEKLKTILSLFVKTHISSSENDEQYGTIQVQKKVQEMDGIDRTTILRLLGEVKTENLPMILLCVNTTLTPHVKASEIINAIDTAKNVLQPQNKDLSQLNLTAIDINKIPIITQFIPQLFNGKETLEKKIGIFNIIGKADLHQIEHLIGNSLKLIPKGMLGGHKIEILQMCQSVEQEKFEKILPCVLSIINKEKVVLLL